MLKKLRIPHTLVLLFLIMLAAMLATYLLPQGTYQTVTNESGRSVVVPGSYHQLPEAPLLKPWHIFTALPRAFADSQDIIFFVFIIGGALAVIRRTGAIDALLGKMLEKFGDRPHWLLAISLFIFSVGSATLGMGEEYLPFTAVLIALCTALGFDVITAVGIIVVGSGIGYGISVINPFTVMIAQDIADLRPTSGIWFRLVLFVPFFLIGWHHVHRYAMRVRRRPESSLYSANAVKPAAPVAYPALNNTHWVILGATVLAVLLLVYGISEASGWHWYLTELGAVFFALAVLAAVVGKMNANEAATAFGEGASELAMTALLIGFARSIALILEDGHVLHTIVYGLSQPLQELGPALAAVGMFGIQSLLNFFIPSGSGQAFVTMPLMAPIADLTGVSRQIAVLAYQFGDGFTNMIVPTNAVLMGILGIAGVPFDRWFRFIIPLMVKLWIFGSLALIVAVWIGYR